MSLIERLREETVIQQGEPVTLIMPDGTTTECPGAVTTMRRNPDGPEAADRLEAMQAEIERRDEALSWAEGHDPWLVEKIRERASLSDEMGR